MFSLIILGLSSVPAMAENGIRLITKEKLKAELDNPDLIIPDVRKEEDWSSSEFKINGLVISQNLTQRRKRRKVNLLILKNFFLASLRENIVFTSSRLRALKGGWDGWLSHKYPVEER